MAISAAPAVRQLEVRIETPAATVWRGSAASAVVPTVSGEFGILPRRSPMLAILAPGTARITTPDGRRVAVAVTEGYVSIDDDAVVILADDATLVTSALPHA